MEKCKLCGQFYEPCIECGTRPTADLGEDSAAMLYQEAGQLDDPARANAIRQAADRLILYREALEPFANMADANMNDPLSKWLRVGHIQHARAVLSRSGL